MAGILTAAQDKTEQLLGLLNAALNPAVSAPTVVSATAQQDATGLPSTVYVAITGGTSGTVAVAIGPTSAVADAVIPAIAATANVNAQFRLPAGWWFKVTVGGSAVIASAAQITG